MLTVNNTTAKGGVNVDKGATLIVLERLKRGTSQKDFAAEHGIYIGTFGRIEKRRLVGNKEVREKIASALGGKVEDFFDPETGLAI
jgi:transcriptional regulator with XRE-family HTH domain